MTTDIDLLSQAAEEIRNDAKKAVVEALRPLFEQHPIVDTVSFLNPNTYNDEGYSFPSNRGWGRAAGTLSVNGCDEYDQDDLEEDELPAWEEAFAAFQDFHYKHENALFLLFGSFIEVNVYKPIGKNADLVIQVYDLEY